MGGGEGSIIVLVLSQLLSVLLMDHVDHGHRPLDPPST